MAGKKGMVHRKPRNNTLREKAWRSIRILRKFTVETVLITSTAEPDDADYENLVRWFRHLLKHGVIRRDGPMEFRTAGSHQRFVLARDSVVRPLFCEICGQSLAERVCDPSLKEAAESERKREKERQKKKERKIKKEKEADRRQYE